MTTINNLVVSGKASGLKRMSCTEVVVDPAMSSDQLSYKKEECVYFVSSGYATFRVRSSSAEWEYMLQQDSAMWLSDSADHEIINDGGAPLSCVCFRFSVPRSLQRSGKEVQRRVIDLSMAPCEIQRGILQRFGFRDCPLPSSGIDTFESSLLAPGCGFPPHFNNTIEGIAWVVRGKGVAAQKGAPKEIRPGAVVVWPAGEERFVKANPDTYLQIVYLNVLV